MTSLGVIGVIIMTAGLVAAIFGFSGTGGIILILLGALIITIAILRSYHKSRLENSERSFQQAQQGLPNYAVVPAYIDAAATSTSSAAEYGQVPYHAPVPIWTPSGSLEMPPEYPVAPVHYKENDNPPSYSELFGNKT